MIDKEAIKEMTKGDATAAACEAMDAAYALRGPVALAMGSEADRTAQPQRGNLS